MIDLDEHALDVLLAEDPGGPVVMLNLLRFRPDGGRETYQRWLETLGPLMGPRYGVQQVYAGEGGRALIAEDGQAWDLVLLARYPSRQVFVAMMRDPDFRAAAHLRTEALVESVLQPTVPLAGRRADD